MTKFIAAAVIASAAVCGAGAAFAQSDMPACGTLPNGVDDYACVCAPGAGTGSVWGSGPYTADSDICKAARHAGVIGETGGAVSVTRAPGEAKYAGTAANGVTTSDWGAYSSSILIAGLMEVAECGAYPSGALEHSCTCAPGAGTGAVWGSGPYTADSDICAAARHAGVIGLDGGTVTALGMDGLTSYRGTERNGIRTQDWAEYGESFVIDANAP